VYSPDYQEAKHRQNQLIRDAQKHRLIASLKHPAPRRQASTPAFSLRIADLRPAI
jgi:hypothetical protein